MPDCLSRLGRELIEQPSYAGLKQYSTITIAEITDKFIYLSDQAVDSVRL